MTEQPLEQGATRYQFSVYDWQSGVYFVQIQTETERKVIRLVVGSAK